MMKFNLKQVFSNGTYIRTLCEDIAEKLGNVGAMSALERTQVGIYGLDDCYSLDEIHENSQLLDVKKAIALEHIVDASLAQTIEHGKRITLTSENDTVLVDAGAFFAVYTRESGTTFKTVSSDIEDKELLLNKIKEFEQNISDLKDEIETLKDDDTFTTISQLDNWDEYFEELKNELTEQKTNQ